MSLGRVGSMKRDTNMSTRILVAFLILFACLASPVQAGPPKKLNIIVITTDDQARWSLGCYGNKEARTPHMDRLAKDGAKFLHAFVATPVCSPSRASFLTGRYGTQVKKIG